ncbi:MAG TPA: ribonuclease P protein component [Rhodospirillaceae bacterium]|nr:ribonuclease P protein component [Alphaproteobacteria bacterium]OUT39169.1 MAG: ribonuclease P protein component [Micavibrio sp. TMED2]HCI46121.1 ribonuclease P protein component [Rhodospirillaceae bacterium]MAS48510.1 ribonuclease P protein component [Alphaproteobacteria bacterium]MAX96232.1 ribonuclease P protein component [Alphaproteobacteria bacterium]|tara:strand:- start:13604 stop:14005 length:402 start_codon:yes stop_codon:yes gene_type:complete
MLPRLKQRGDFVRLNRRGKRAAAVGLVVQVDPIPAGLDRKGDDSQMRVGFTATKKLGSAVVRNRVKRRLRALADEMLPVLARPGHDFVLIGRHATATRDFAALRRDFIEALKRLKMVRDGADNDLRQWLASDQ